MSIENIRTDFLVLVIFELEKYLEYVDKQETQLGVIEQQKSLLSNTFFKDNKENTSITLNAEI